MPGQYVSQMFQQVLWYLWSYAFLAMDMYMYILWLMTAVFWTFVTCYIKRNLGVNSNMLIWLFYKHIVDLPNKNTSTSPGRVGSMIRIIVSVCLIVDIVLVFLYML